MIDKIISKISNLDNSKLDSIYCGFIGGISGIISFFHQVGIDESFIGTLIKTAGVAAASTFTGLIIKQVWFSIFPKNKNNKYD